MVEPSSRRHFSGYVLAAPILVTAAELAASTTTAGPPSSDGTELLGLNDIMTAAALPTSGLISVEVSQDGTVSFTLPRTRLGQGASTSTATLIAEELSVPRGRVRVTLIDAWPEHVSHQGTAGPDTTMSTYAPLRVAAAVARQRLLEAASAAFGSPVVDLRLKAGVITDGDGRSLDIGALATKAASASTVAVVVELAPREGCTVVGCPATGSTRGRR
ncbi:Molybdopterin-binding domain of aldehyde dehydrogenase [Micromonospora echinospora]|uniref:Molybdopterin-binding domain of aldehyde dehydrogenase n=1 Tax=Micromonospora echinospora TaxID=1877 RepID=A0A1C4ZL34_MICEC|nr:molybdopterin cofactor-binding domain-containing protein [Micromonospora echinospora]SCF33536.1 Molybdopterin-binding domain of aldehyde dehydrogenase [Micromonospora echinospora]